MTAIAAIIGGVAALGAGAMSMKAQGDASSKAAGVAGQNRAVQEAIARQQYDLATAGRIDARGNKTEYVPGVGWVETPTNTTAGIIKASDAAQRQQLVDLLTRNRGERDLAFDRRLEEGKVADPLLEQIKYQFGAPTKESVVGADKISRVTGVNEQADNVKSGIGSAFLRTGMNVNPTALAGVDRAATTGVRKALADADAGGDPLFQAHLASFMKGKTDPYNLMATRASNIENIPFQPEQISGNMDASLANAAAVGATRGTTGASEGAYRGFAPLINLANNGGPDYGAFVGGVGEHLKNYLREYGAKTSGLNSVGTESDYSGWGVSGKGGPRGPGDPKKWN